MHPVEREFLALVLRYLDLAFRPERDPADARELEELTARLRVQAPANGPSYERRVYRRIPTQIPSGARKDGLCAPCTVLDLSAGGVRIDNRGGIEVRPGDRVILSLHPGEADLRIDIPSRVCHVCPTTGRVGLAFCGVPVVSHTRAGGTAPADRHDTRETPLARTLLRMRDLAA